MYRAHCCEQYRAHDRKPDSTVLKQIAARLVEQFRGDVPADLDLTIAEARARPMGRSAPDGRASGNQELECSSELRRTGRAKCSVRRDICRYLAGCAAPSQRVFGLADGPALPTPQ